MDSYSWRELEADARLHLEEGGTERPEPRMMADSS
jgi:hypothetical protein